MAPAGSRCIGPAALPGRRSVATRWRRIRRSRSERTSTIGSQSRTVTQAGAPCAYSLSRRAPCRLPSTRSGPGASASHARRLWVGRDEWSDVDRPRRGRREPRRARSSFTVSPNATVGTRRQPFLDCRRGVLVTQAAGMPTSSRRHSAICPLPSAGATFTAIDTVQNQGLVTAAASTDALLSLARRGRRAPTTAPDDQPPLPILVAGASSTATGHALEPRRDGAW